MNAPSPSECFRRVSTALYAAIENPDDETMHSLGEAVTALARVASGPDFDRSVENFRGVISEIQKLKSAEGRSRKLRIDADFFYVKMLSAYENDQTRKNAKN
jgi:hypothetical protein